MSNYELIGKQARKAAYELQKLSTTEKNILLLEFAKALTYNSSGIIFENQKDLDAGKTAGLTNSFLDRLKLDSQRINEISQALIDLSKLNDPVGEVLETWELPSGIGAKKIRVPLGVIAIIYEARPNVTVDAAALCLKTSNATILKGGSSALNSNRKLVEILRNVLIQKNYNPDMIQLIDDPERDSINQVLKMHGMVDVVIPRGGAGLINHVVKNSTVPVIETGAGNCHLFLDLSAKQNLAVKIALNAKVQRPSVCNAIETLLWHKDLPEKLVLAVVNELEAANVECRVCEETLKILPNRKLADLADWSTEYSDLVIAVKKVDNVEAAVEHINQYGTKHSDVIITEDQKSAEYFLNTVDAACVYWNASSRFTDGGQFGFGAEIGISTQKIHARGPMGLKELTSYKYILNGLGKFVSKILDSLNYQSAIL